MVYIICVWLVTFGSELEMDTAERGLHKTSDIFTSNKMLFIWTTGSRLFILYEALGVK